MCRSPKAGFYYHHKHDPKGPLNNYAYFIYGIGHHTEDECRPEDAFMQVVPAAIRNRVCLPEWWDVRPAADRHDLVVPDDVAQGLHGRAQPDGHPGRRPGCLLYENYACGGVGNYNGYCNKEIDRLIDQQSMEPDQLRRKHLVWEIERRLRMSPSR